MSEKTNEARNMDGTAKNHQNRDNTQYCLSYCLTLSETSLGIFSRMDKNTPSNELTIRGWA